MEIRASNEKFDACPGASGQEPSLRLSWYENPILKGRVVLFLSLVRQDYKYLDRICPESVTGSGPAQGPGQERFNDEKNFSHRVHPGSCPEQAPDAEKVTML